jgi:hypothetical protein
MKNYLLALLFFFKRLTQYFSLSKIGLKQGSSSKLKLSILLFFTYISLWAQPPLTFNSTGPLLVPAGVTQMTVQAWGGGGAGGGASGAGVLSGRGGAGGGGGAYASSLITVVPGVNLSVTVAGQTAGTAGAGTSGGSSTIVGFENMILAVGGDGGQANTSGGSPAGGAGGKASTSFGTTKADGGNGGIGESALLSFGLNSGFGGKGGSTGGGAGGPLIASGLFGNKAGNPGTSPGGGGGGAINSALAAAQLGGTGAAGQVIVAFTCPSYSISGTAATGVCVTDGNSTITLTSNAASLPAGTYVVSYNLTNPTANALTASMTVSTAGTGSFVLSGLTTPATRNITITNITSGACSSSINTGNTASILISAATVGGTIGGVSPICSGSTSGLLSLSGNTGSVLKWQYSVNPFSTWVDIANTTASYTSGALTETTQFRAVVQNGACAIVNSALTTVTVNPLPQGSLTANGPFCATGAGQLTWTATAGTGPFTIIYTENGGASRTATGIVSGTPFAAFTTPVIGTTNYALVSVTGANNCIRSSAFTAGSATITVNPLSQGSLTANGPFCATGAGQLTWTATAGTGPFTIIYTENGGANRTATGVVSGTPFATFTTPVIGTTNYALVSVTDTNSCARLTGFTGGAAIITINPIPAPSFSAQPASTVCVNTDVTYTTLAGQTNYIWTVPGTAGTDYSILSGGIGTTNNTVTLQWITAGSKTVIVGYSSIGCTSVANASNTTTVTKTDRGVVNGGLHICIGNPSPLLTLHNYSGTIVRWEYAEAIPYVWQPLSNTSDTYQPGILSTSTSYRAVVKNGTCPEEFAIETRIDVDPNPPAPTIFSIIQPNCTVPTGSIVLNGLSGSGNVLKSDGTTVTYHPFSGSSTTISGLVPGKYSFAIDNSCLVTYSVEIKIQPNTWDGSSWSYGLDPTVDDLVDFQEDYYLSKDVDACSCTISNDAFVMIQNGKTLNLVKGLHVVSGSLTFADGANLLQASSDNNLNTGEILYKRKSQPIRKADYVYWSSPVKGQRLVDVSPLTESDKYFSYNGTQWIKTPNNSVMTVGKGYIIRGPENFSNAVRAPFATVFAGIPNNGDITGETVEANKFYLVGNPYPSALNADDFITGNSLLEGTLYFWTHNTPVDLGGAAYEYAADDYASYNLTGGVRTALAAPSGNNPTQPENNNSVPMGQIAAGQSFFVETTASGVIVFNNTMRRGGNTNNQFFKPGKEAETTAIQKSRIWLNMTNSGGAFKQLLVGYLGRATNGYDRRYDGDSFNGNKYLDFYSISNESNLAIQGRALPFINTDIVPLGYRTTIDGEFTIAIESIDGSLTTQAIYLEDKKTGIIHDLRAGNYTFTTVPGTFTDRFVLRYTNKSLGIDEIENPENNLLISVRDKTIKVTSAVEMLSDVSVFDPLGKLIYNKKKVNATELQINNLQSGNQVLLVKVTLENGNITTRKIIF